ncbi:hypothetical protein LAT59_02725 [Candidatus Gracilibacteria bacterium]|nr:hypothetical protein [Candidatus Gracilibacteria bacterium]
MINASFEFTKDTVSEKLKSPFWRSFIVGWLTWNWQVWYVTFFVSEEMTGKSKIDYIISLNEYFIPVLGIDFSVPLPIFFGLLINWIIIPGIISYIVVFFITEIITHFFLRKQYELEEKEIYIKNSYYDKKSDSIDKLSRLLKKEEKVVEKEKSIDEMKDKNKFGEWDEEYINFTPKSYLQSLSTLIYEYNGEIGASNHSKRFDANFEMLIDLHGLVTANGKVRSHNTYTITEKGKYFLKKYKKSNEINISKPPYVI